MPTSLPSSSPRAVQAFLRQAGNDVVSGSWKYSDGSLTWATLELARWNEGTPELLPMVSTFPAHVRRRMEQIEQALKDEGKLPASIDLRGTSPWTVGALGSTMLDDDAG